MIKNFFMASLMGLGFMLSAVPATAGYVYVQVGPPAPIYETVPARPGAGYVWVGGYYRYTGGRYVWSHGYWAHHGGHWCAGTWHHGHHGYYWTDGRWC
ncbi:MAG TPA: hypothetical protein VGX91_00160 [Candidatus Cybelea sp.]|jgi:hypothetical protein|nr:hypothetical protein [Candidatus Cybelea sp.]